LDDSWHNGLKRSSAAATSAVSACFLASDVRWQGLCPMSDEYSQRLSRATAVGCISYKWGESKDRYSGITI